MITTSYGTWVNHGGGYHTSPGAEILTAINGGPPEWRDSLEIPGSDGETPLEAMEAAYRSAINSALPADVALCGEEFIGPWEPENGEFDGYPATEFGGLDIAAIVADVDLYAIVEAHDPDLA